MSWDIRNRSRAIEKIDTLKTFGIARTQIKALRSHCLQYPLLVRYAGPMRLVLYTYAMNSIVTYASLTFRKLHKKSNAKTGLRKRQD
jgi:hypothetical protein